MAKDTSSALGAPQLAGSIVNARTVARKLTRGAAGPVEGSPSGQAPELPHFGRVGFLAVTRDEIGFGNAVVWQFDVPRLNRRRAQEVVRELRGQDRIGIVARSYVFV
jgi:hypothetical protein